MRGYARYSIGCAVAWAIVWATVGRRSEVRPRLLLFFVGWVAGWTSATIARYVYPPPAGRAERRPA